jgi:hypothetical protein
MLVGKPVFPPTMGQAQIARKVVTTDERPDIPAYILPSTRKLITACWAFNPDDRPSFERIVEYLQNMKFQVIPNVNLAKMMEFVKMIEALEGKDGKIPQ